MEERTKRGYPKDEGIFLTTEAKLQLKVIIWGTTSSKRQTESTLVNNIYSVCSTSQLLVASHDYSYWPKALKVGQSPK